MKEGITINAYQDGDRLILSFENATPDLKTSILSMLQVFMLHNIEGLSDGVVPDYQKAYEAIEQKVEEKEDNALTPESTETANDYATEAVESSTETGPTKTDEGQEESAYQTSVSEDCTIEQSENQIDEGTPFDYIPEEILEDAGKANWQDSCEEETDTDEDKTHEDLSELGIRENGMVYFLTGTYANMTPFEAIAKDHLNAVSFFYKNRNQSPYNQESVSDLIRHAVSDYIAKITKGMKKYKTALCWLYDVYEETGQELKNMGYPSTKEGIDVFCSKESEEQQKMIVVMLFNKMIERISNSNG